MEFRVDETYLDAMAARLDTLDGQADSAGSYVSHLDLPGAASGGAMFAYVSGANADLVASLDSAYELLRSVTHASAAEVRATATSYRATDTSTAAALDASYPG